MRRLLLIPVALLGLFCAGAFASIKQANSAATARISSLSPTSITVGKRHHPHLTCELTDFSPSTVSFAIGDRVKIACSNRVLVAISDMSGSSNSRRTDDELDSSGISGKVSGIGPKFITVHDGDRGVTCTVGPDSPSITSYNVGDHVKIGCVNGVLVSVGAPTGSPGITTSGSTTTTSVTNANGPITLLNTTSITVQTMTCTFGPSSPSLAGFHLGDSVRMYCLSGVLYELKHNDTPPPGPTTTTTTISTTTTTTQQSITGISGTITVLTDGSITATSTGNDPTTLPCTIGPSSPSTAGFAIGSAVRMYCVNGVLYQLKHNDTQPPTTSTTTTTTTTAGSMPGANGNLNALTTSSITVGDLTCSIGPSSPSVSGYAVSQSVRMYCQNGALYALFHN